MPLDEDQLKYEVSRAHRAERAYEDFIKPFIKSKQEVFYEAFMSTEPDDFERLAEIRRMTMAIDALDHEIKEFIITGKMAAIQLAGNEDD